MSIREAIKSTSARIMLGVLIGTGGVAAAQSTGRTYCYTPTWFTPTQVCNTCELYSNCPGKILCTLSQIGGGPDPIVIAPFSCPTFHGGTGNCAQGTCTGGFPTPSAASVIIPQQTCTTACIKVQPVPQ